MAGVEGVATLVRTELDGPVATLALSDEEHRNVLDEPMALALTEAIAALAEQPEVRCVVLTGTGRAFAAGADIKEIAAKSREQNLAYNRVLRDSVDAVAGLAVPSVAAVNGHAIGGGLELALACTLRVAAAEAKLGLPEAKLGIIPATGGLARLPRTIGRGAAARLLLTGDLVDGREAQALGLVDAAVPGDSVLEEATALAGRIAAAAPLSTRAIVDALRGDEGLPIAEANLRTEQRLAGLLDSEDRREGANAFLERREPQFRGS